MTEDYYKSSLIDLTETPLVLASRSPRRIALLTEMGVPFETHPSGIEEPDPGGRPPEELAVDAARLKARGVASGLPGRLVLGADTIVCLQDRVLGKPADPEEARSMLDALQGRWHRVVTGLCLVTPDGSEWTACEQTRVRMETFARDELERYLATGEPYDKAGGYAIQGEAARLVAEIDGDYFNVVGLPLALLLKGLSRFAATGRCTIPRPPERFSPPVRDR